MFEPGVLVRRKDTAVAAAGDADPAIAGLRLQRSAATARSAGGRLAVGRHRRATGGARADGARAANESCRGSGRARAIDGGRAERPRHSRIARAVSGGLIAARMRIEEQHRGHSRTSLATTRSIDSAKESECGRAGAPSRRAVIRWPVGSARPRRSAAAPVRPPRAAVPVEPRGCAARHLIRFPPRCRPGRPRGGAAGRAILHLQTPRTIDNPRHDRGG